LTACAIHNGDVLRRRLFVSIAALALQARAGDQRETAEISQAVARVMGDRQGCALVASMESGELVAAAGLERAARRLVRPGSTLKPFVLLALAEQRIVDRRTSRRCDRRVGIGSRALDCGHPDSGPPPDAAAALAYSCNSFFAHFAIRLGEVDLAQALPAWGFTAKTGLARGEVAGAIGIPRSPEERQLQALGEANIEVTPLELLAAYRRLWRHCSSPGSRQGCDLVLEGLAGCTRYGTGRLAQPAHLEVAGKTGTSVSLDGAWTHAWFAGWAPARAPEIVVLVFLEHGRGGAQAAPVARELFEAWQRGKHR